jgi:hypothetical protein
MLSIRTQNRMTLVPYNKPITIATLKAQRYINSKWEDGIYVLCIFHKDLELNNLRLGTYKSKERALEVLDEIEEMSCDVYRGTINIFEEEIAKGKNGIRNNVYQMPKE